MTKRVTSSLRQETGVITYLVALLLPVLLGMGALVMDISDMWQVKRHLQNCADAAALAGAWELNDTVAARSIAMTYLVSQGASLCLDGTNPPLLEYIDRDGDGVPDALGVTVGRNVAFSFARFLGFDTGTPKARAVAGKITPSEFLDMEPFGLQVDPGQECGRAGLGQYKVNGQPLAWGVTYTIKYTPGTGGFSGDAAPGNFQALALGATGGSNYRDNIQYGYTGWVSSCETLQTETGNKVGPTIDGLDARLFNDSSLDTWTNCIVAPDPQGYTRWSDCPRVISIAIIAPLEMGRTDAHVLTFGWFFIESYQRRGNRSAELTGKFIDASDRHAPPEEWRGNTPWSPNSALPFGVKLLE